MTTERARQFSTMKNTFFAMDRFPDNATRFPLDMDDALALYSAFLSASRSEAV
jgi:hypothetical protein